jgi:hypothetical protein
VEVHRGLNVLFDCDNGIHVNKVTSVAILASVLLLRSVVIATQPLAPDEAESSINALSILEHGVPTHTYLGIPIFENMLIRPWPGHPEYEFRDISYSDRGLAVYHAWMPLYAIAASLAAFGITPQGPVPGWTIPIDEKALMLRTVAPRVPSLIFSAVFLCSLYVAGRRLGDETVAVTALVIAGFSSSIVQASVQARYYSLTLVLSAAAALTLWRVIERGSWRDWWAQGAVLTALFYTHLIEFVIVLMLTVSTIAWTGLRTRLLARQFTALAVTACLTSPWLLFTGFFDQLQHLPSGLVLKRFPDDLLVYASERPVYLLIYGLGFGCVAAVWALRGRALPARFQQPWRTHRRQFLLLLVWMILSVLSWYVLLPAASQFPQRLSLCLFVPGTLVLALVMADVGRMISPGQPAVVAWILAFAFLQASGLLVLPPRAQSPYVRVSATFTELNRLQLLPDARVYASPASHLVLSFYSSKPIQSLAPVRKTFLDTYPGEVLFIEATLQHEFTAPSAQAIETAAASMGQHLSPGESSRWEDQLRSRLVSESVRDKVSEVTPPVTPVPPFVEAALAFARDEARLKAVEHSTAMQSLPFYRGYDIYSGGDLWEVFFYRLVDPDSRRGPRLNAADRFATGRAYVSPQALKVFLYAPPLKLPSKRAGTAETGARSLQ